MWGFAADLINEYCMIYTSSLACSNCSSQKTCCPLSTVTLPVKTFQMRRCHLILSMVMPRWDAEEFPQLPGKLRKTSYHY
jgi:hypothetical protein